jgi:serine phosphatase RsbU (regulator of sigma subunit)/PAS domain-containing protein
VPRTPASRAKRTRPAAAAPSRVAPETAFDRTSNTQPDDQAAELRDTALALRHAADVPGTQLRPVLDAVFTELDQAIGLLGKHGQERDEGAQARSDTADTERRLLRAVFQEVPAPIFLLERDGSIRRVNRQAATLLSTEPGSETGKPFTSLVDLRDRPSVRSQLTALIRTGRPRQLRCSLLSTAGKVQTALTIDLVERPGESGPLIMAVIGPAIMPQGPRDPGRTSIAGDGDSSGHAIAEAAQRFDLISAATRLLLENAEFGESLMLRRCASLLAAELSAWVIVDVEQDGMMRRFFVAGPVSPRFADLDQAIEDRDPEAGTLPWEVHETGRSQLLTELPDESVLGSVSSGEPVASLLNATSALCTPLTDGQRRYGTLTLVRRSETGAFGAADLELVEEISQQLAVAVKIGRMFLRRSAVSEALQASLLPRDLPAVRGAEIATCYVPCAEELGVGGDFYDVYPSAGAWGLVIGDVGGRGEVAAAVTAMARYTIRVLAHWNPEPKQVLRMANELMMAHDTEHFVTATAAHLRWEAGVLRVRYSSAGHPGPFLVRRDHRIRMLASGGMPLGLFDDARPTAEEIDLEPGDVLLFYSNGVTGAQNADGEYFENRIGDELAGLAGRPASEVVSSIKDCVLEFCESDLRDDLTMVALRVLEQPDQIPGPAASGVRLWNATLQV